MTVLYGITPVHAALVAGKRSFGRLWVKEGKPSPRVADILREAKRRGVTVAETTAERVGDKAKSPQHQGVALECGELPLVTIEEFLGRIGQGSCTLAALDRVEDPVNLGGIVRSAAFLGVSGVIAMTGKAAPFSAAASKASAGTMETHPMIGVGNLAEALRALRDAGFWIYGAAGEEDAEDYRRVDPAPRSVVVMGNEGEGLRRLTRDRCDVLVRIPGSGDAESLNVNVAAGILFARFTGR